MKTVRDRRASRWDAHRQARRVELTDAAILAIRTHGAGVGMDDVAAQAGTSKTVVYRHFADRTELYVAVCARVAEVLLAQVRAAMDGAEGPHAQTAAGIEAYLRLIEHDPEVYRFVVHRPLVDRSPGADPVADLVSLVGDQVAAVIATRTGDAATAVPWGHGIVGMVRAAADNWLARGGRGDVTAMTRSQLAAHLTELAWAGLSGVTASKEDS
ncbi:TetR family transcriptional regulator [Pseudonocardia hydrocarbonoxydans]|uniref:TetR family transcriptional regulator n=1 Tax=Pseudonocardia hydrocarbonoxydans TaxID=76726 RepID=A0A4Y3WSK5_9PSEU|nr:TetR family transcriptional regulator [Pseudonocardia hydrocarbonoxydans]GEC21833.1 TetR family transcriptional regulator [Pseudonocardia hydrocarbonoxydans]